MGDEGRRAEEGGAVTDLLLSFDEEFVKGLDGSGFAQGDVDGEIGADVVVCSPCKWASLILRLDRICWLENLRYDFVHRVGSWHIGQHERGRLRCIHEKQRQWSDAVHVDGIKVSM